MSPVRSFLRRVMILKGTFNQRRLKTALDLVRHCEFRRLFLLIRLHTTFRLQLRQIGIDTSEPGPALPAETLAYRTETYEESDWPKERPLVSVVIPCFNYGKYVGEAIDSVLAQTWGDLEIIVVEGGSTDTTTRGVIETLQHPAVITLFRDSPCRAGDNRNYGIQRARGKYICCLDADDMLRPTYIEKAVFILECYGYDIVSTSVRRFGAIEECYDVAPTPDLASMLEGNHITTCAVFRRSLWQQAGGFQDTGPDVPFVHEDWRFWVRLSALGGRVRNIGGEQLFCYRAHATPSLSAQPDLLPIPLQARLVRELNQDVISPAAIARSRAGVATRRHATNGVGNLLGRSQPDDARTTVLLAVPYLILGGAERLLSEVMRGCRKAGFRVVVVTTIPTIPALGDTTSWFEPATDEIYHLPRFLSQCYWKDFVEYLVGAKAVSMVMLAGSTFFYDAIPDLKIRHPHLTVVDLLFNTIGHTESNRRIAASLDLTFVEGEDVHDWLTARGEQPERICLVPSGVDLDRYQPMPRPDDILAAMGLAADVFIAGFSGRLAEEKAPLAFLAIAAELPIALPVHFVMTGAGPMEEQVRAAAHRSPIAERVHFRGLVDDVRDYLACYDVLVVPSVIDGRPTVVMEALAMGIPVVASRVGSLPRLVIDGETGFLCEPGDVRGFAAKITQLHDDPVLRSRMGQAARRFAEQHFLLRTMVSRYVSTISRLVDAKRRHSPAENRGPDLERVAAVAEPSSYDLAPPVDSEPGRGDSLI